MDAMWSQLDDFPLLPEQEKSDGDVNMSGP